MGIRKKLSKSSKAQAMVEFALIATVLLMLIFIVIEAARILWAWNTVQNSAREGIRYAITGQSLGTGFCPVDGFPKFDDTPGGRDVCSIDDNNRVASIIVKSHTALSGLPLNETTTAYEEDEFYNIEVWGVNPDLAPDDTLVYDFGGRPNYPVIVRVTYRVPIITPLLRPIAKSVPVFGQVALNNENFGSLSGAGETGSSLPPNLPALPTPGVTPSPTATSTETPVPTAGASPTATETGIPTATPTKAICPVSFVQPPVANQTSVLVTGEVGLTVEVWDVTTKPNTLLATTVLLDRGGYACDGFADFVPSTHPALNAALIVDHDIMVFQYISGNSTNGGVEHSRDTARVLERLPTPTATHTNTPLPTATETPLPTVTPTSTPGSPFIVLLPNCGGKNTIGDVVLSIQGFNWNDKDNILLEWVAPGKVTQLTVIDESAHAGSFSFSRLMKSIPPNVVYTVRASVKNKVISSAQFTVPCDSFEPTPITATPTNTPRPVDLLVISPPQIISSVPITAYTPVDFTVVITNEGDIDVNSQFFVDIYIEPSEVYTTHIPIEYSTGYSAVSSLAGGASKVLTITSPLGFANNPATDPDFFVYSMVDSAGAPGFGQVQEDDEGNNVSLPLAVNKSNIIQAATPTATPTVDPNGVKIVAGTVSSRNPQLAAQFRAAVTLFDSSGNRFSTTLTDENGYYQFSNVPDDTYTVQACIEIDSLGFTGYNAGITPTNFVANVNMIPGACVGAPTPINHAPVVSNPGDQYTLVGDAISLPIVATDNEGDTLTFSALGLPTGVTIDSSTGTIVGVPTVAGQYSVGILVDDGTNQTKVFFNWIVLTDELRMETLTISSVTSGNWKGVTTTNNYASMVVVCSIRYANNSLPQVVRMQHANNGHTFDIRLQNPSGSTLGGETVDCLVMEEGVWQLANGDPIEARKYTSTVTDGNGSWNGQVQTYGQSYSSPVVFGQVMSYNDSNWSTFWARGAAVGDPPNSSVIRTGKMIGKDNINPPRANETVGYIVIQAGERSIDGEDYRAAVGNAAIRGVVQSPPYRYTYSSRFRGRSPEFGLATQAGMNGLDGSWAYTYGSDPLGNGRSIDLAVDEEQIVSNRTHTGEQVGYFVIQTQIVLP